MYCIRANVAGESERSTGYNVSCQNPWSWLIRFHLVVCYGKSIYMKSSDSFRYTINKFYLIRHDKRLAKGDLALSIYWLAWLWLANLAHFDNRSSEWSSWLRMSKFYQLQNSIKNITTTNFIFMCVVIKNSLTDNYFLLFDQCVTRLWWQFFPT